MKVYIQPKEDKYRAVRRVVTALDKHKPAGIQVVNEIKQADLVVLHVIGRQDSTTNLAQHLHDSNKKYAVIQYSVRSTMRPSTEGWRRLWLGAELVWSYLPLVYYCSADDQPFDDFGFYYAPLGADPDIFYPRYRHHRQIVIATHGHSAVTESVKEAVVAAKRVGRPVFHLGRELNRGLDVMCFEDVSDDHLAGWLSQCQFVAGLRRTEGFELPAAEGLLCGARPICFESPHYRAWYDDWAIFIPEGDRNEVIDSLEAVFKQGAHKVTPEEIEEAKQMFDWQQIVGNFWNAVLENAAD